MDGNRTAPEPNEWCGLRAIETLKRLNAECFARLADVARTETCPVERSPIYRERELWKRVDDRACGRAARCPVMLLNLHFERIDWWKRVCSRSVDVKPATPNSLFAHNGQSQSLLRQILMEVWRLERVIPNATNLLFGMAPGVSAQISNLSVLEIERTALTYGEGLRPRWEENAVFWKNLLEAAIDTEDEVLFAVHLHCLQLLGTDFDPVTTKFRSSLD